MKDTSDWKKLKRGDRIAYILYSTNHDEHRVNRGWIYDLDHNKGIMYLFIANDKLKEINIVDLFMLIT